RLLGLRVMTKLDPRQQLAGSVARLRRRDLVGVADCGAAGVGVWAVLRGPIAQPAPRPAAAQAQAQPLEPCGPPDLVGAALRQCQGGDGLGVKLELHGVRPGSAGEAARAPSCGYS